MNITTLSVLTVAFSLFAVDAFAQANHNTTRSNKTTPQVSDTQTETDKAKATADKLGDIEGETQRAVKGYIKIGDIKGESTKAVTPTGCVMFSGGMDNDCDGIEDGKAPSAKDYNSSRSNKADTATDTKPDIDAKATDYNSSRSNKHSNN